MELSDGKIEGYVVGRFRGVGRRLIFVVLRVEVGVIGGYFGIREKILVLFKWVLSFFCRFL